MLIIMKNIFNNLSSWLLNYIIEREIGNIDSYFWKIWTLCKVEAKSIISFLIIHSKKKGLWFINVHKSVWYINNRGCENNNDSQKAKNDYTI